MDKKIHEGRNVKRFRELLGIKQDTLAAELGDDWNQKKISMLEQKESIEADILEQVANVLKIPAAAIRNFDEDKVLNIVTNTYSDNSENTENTFSDYAINVIGNNHQWDHDFDPQEKWIEAMAEQRKLVDEIRQLHAQIIKEKEDKMELYERLLSELKNRA